ncbi:Polyamine aminopropyltransferase [Thalassocella blandensis]|nr:Polyamine aminopropyltransferase [Thalassocella blandensis]
MATIWFKQTEHCRYEVRTAGNSIRLYSNGVFHSQWNPKKPIAGHLWDLLFFPMCFHEDWAAVNNALILGVGGGAVINLLQKYCALEKIVAVDLDEQHFYVAEKFFKINEGVSNVLCVLRDAKNYVLMDDATAQGLKQDAPRFQFILEDLFLNEAGTSNAVRAIKADVQWLQSLANRLSEDGILVMNFESARQLRAALSAKTLGEVGFVSVAELSLPRYENAIAVLSKAPLIKSVFQAQLANLEHAAKFSFQKNEYVLRFRKL